MKAIIFDMDGLMIDSERIYIECEKSLALSFGRTIREETIWKMMGKKPIESLTIFKEDLELDLPAEELLALRDGMFEERLRKELQAMPGLFEILGEFYGKVKLAIATGNIRKFMDIVLDGLNIRHYFDVLQTSEKVVSGKPDPEIYLVAIKQLEVEPEECIVLEDSGNGALAGKRAGCYTIAVPSEYTCKNDFSFADYIARDLHDAKAHITQCLEI
ncbi:MAG: HAD family phosphatase [Clostridia bacterium]|nr:HAD family phosphatase [Clostridia bacterium]